MSMDTDRKTAVIDLRSDTVTLPTEAMYTQMRAAELGDDGLDGDPTAAALEQATAALLNKPCGLYAPSATMANLLAILAQVGRQETVLAGSGSHIYTAERGAATFTGAFYQPIPDPEGALQLDVLAAALSSTKGHLRPRLVCIESSHNNEGGAVAPLEHLRQVRALAQAAGVPVHLDGARLFNAAHALQVPASAICDQADTVSVCLSKGLSAPMGAVLIGSEELIQRARWLRKLIGGAQRQVGIAAAAGLSALQSQAGRLSQDHATAGELAQGLAAVGGVRIKAPQTNIVMVDVAGSGANAQRWEHMLRERGVLVRPWGPLLMRCVTHRHIDGPAIAHAIASFRAVSGLLQPATAG